MVCVYIRIYVCIYVYIRTILLYIGLELVSCPVDIDQIYTCLTLFSHCELDNLEWRR